MSRADWRSPDAYDDLRSLDAPGFAWEYLRRNPDFLRERRKLQRAARRGGLDPSEVDAFSRRWGVRFRRHGRDEQLRHGRMGTPRPAERDRSDEASD